MPKFIKIQFNTPAGFTTQWELVLETVEDVNKYHGLETALNGEAFIELAHSNINYNDSDRPQYTGKNIRANTLDRWFSHKVNSAKKGEKVYPLFEVANLTDMKYLAMLKNIARGPIRVNEAGGYSDVKGYLKTWNAVIIETIEKNDFGIPTDDEIIKADTIILENSSAEISDKSFEGQVVAMLPGSIKTIYNLREVDMTYVFKSVSNAKNIVIKSQLMYEEQIDSFMKLFANVEPKNIYLFVPEKTEDKIFNHPLYEQNKKHSIKIIHS